ncbi:MAG: SMC-Scp complex subunit ScpB [Terracidiphilus sp.]|jgi:segregation and condensation protein B
MSLKAKLEAVVYAAEEPVTLAQLSALFAAEALEWKAAQEAVSAVAAGGEAEPESSPLLNAGLPDEEFEPPSEPVEPAGGSGEAAPAAESVVEVPETAGPDVAAIEGEPAAETPVEAEAEAKRLARQKDREVRAVLRQLMDELIATYASDDRGIEIKEIAGGYRMATKPECHDAARQFVKSLKPAMKLSLPALETLAVIAYKQPVTAPEVNEIRGVDSSGVFGSLLTRKLIATAGRKQVIGRPILYKTTKEFLLRFGLKDVAELPSMEEFEKLAELEFEEEAAATELPSGEAEVDDLPDTDTAGSGEAVGVEDQADTTNDDGERRGTRHEAAVKEAPEAATALNPEASVEPTAAETANGEGAPAASSVSPEQEEDEAVFHE